MNLGAHIRTVTTDTMAKATVVASTVTPPTVARKQVAAPATGGTPTEKGMKYETSGEAIRVTRGSCRRNQ